LRVLILISLCVLFGQCFAENHPDIFKVREPVSNRSQTQTNAAIQDAFTQVLIRISGHRQFGDSTKIHAARAHIDEYVSERGYTQDDSGLTYLVVGFDAHAIKKLLLDANLPFWGKDRPDILCWIVMDQGQSQQILHAQSTATFHQQLLTQSDLMGLPIVLPLMDLGDASLINPSTIEVNDVKAIQKASKRYDATVTLSAVVREIEPGQYDSIWHLYFSNQQYAWTEHALSQSQTAEHAMNTTFQWLALHFGESDGKQHKLLVGIEGIDSAKSLLQVQKYVSHLEGVDKAMLHSVGHGMAQFSITMHTSESVFMNTLAASQRMVLLGSGAYPMDYVFQWQ